MHSFFNPGTGIFDHFDGAIRKYDEDLMSERKAKNMNQMGHRAKYTKIFRIDGKLPISKWKGLITQYLMDNHDVYRYFGEPVPFEAEAKQTKDDGIGKYVPKVLKKAMARGSGDLIRCLLAPLMWRNPVQSYS